MRRYTEYTLAFALVLVLTAGVVGAGWALPPNPYVSTVYDSVWPYSNQLTATVTNNLDGSYHYQYTLLFLQTSFDSPLSDFSVANVNDFSFTNQGSSDPSLLIGPSTNSVLWNSGTVPVDHTVTFWYDSSHSYGLVDVTLAGGLPSDGKTLGMIPEPGSLLAVACGLGGVLWTRLRRRS